MSSILIIEDDHDIRVSLRQALEAEGYIVHSAASGVEAMRTLKRIAPPKLILLDLQLPLMNGKEFLKAKGNDRDLSPIPVLVISAESPEKATLPGTIGHLVKPIDVDELLEIVGQYC